jgi:tetratricopeptide (TPR) repeat protein
VALNNRGNTYRAKGDLDHAVVDFDQVIRIYPGHAGALYARGMIKQTKGDKAGGDADIAAAKKIDPKIDEP